MRSDEERRRYPRSRRGVPVIVDEGGPGILNHLDNVSGSGVLCHTVRPIALMTKMSIKIDLPEPVGKPVECEGIVVRCEPHDVGDDHFKVAILFTHMSDEDREAVEEFVSHDLSSSTNGD
jgi:hypothetical protein